MFEDAYTEVIFGRQWAERVFSGMSESPAPGDHLNLIHEDGPGDTKIGRCAAGGPIRLGERTYARGIGVNSHSVLRVSLTQPATRFIADIGLDRNVDNTAASVVFHVSVDGQDVFATGIMRPSDRMCAIDVPLGGAREFDLIVDDGGDGRGFDQADWADARVILQDSSKIWLDDMAAHSIVGIDLPFSFIYDGQYSSDFIDNWKREVHDEEIDATKRRHTLTLTDPGTGLEARVVATIYTDTPGVDWTLYFTNTGDRDTPVLEQVKAVDVGIRTGIGSAVELHRLHGSSCAVDDWLPFSEQLTRGKRIEFAPAGGKSSSGACPFFNLQWDGGGVITAIGWSGQWAASVERGEDNTLRIQAGMRDMRLALHPGETIRGPRILQLYWFGDDIFRSYNLFRRTMLNHVLPRAAGKTATPPIAHLSTSFYELNNSNQANVLSHLESIKGLDFEFFWLDAYWTRDGFPNGMGNYGFPIKRAEPPDRFPHGLKPISDAAHEEDMKFLVWFEPERVANGTHIAREHPEWIISLSQHSGGLFNLGIQEAREYMTKYLVKIIEEYGIDCLRIDFNINPLPFWESLNEEEPQRVGMAEIRYVEGHYRMWDDILSAYPGLFIDNCASGGMRIDIETCSRSIPLWRTDATIAPLFSMDFHQAALQNQVITAGLSRYVPFSTSGQMGATPYLFRSGFNAGISFSEDCRPADYPRDLLKEAIVEGKRIRKYYSGNFYPLSDVTTSAKNWCVMQYHRSNEQDGMIIAFRRHQSPYASFVCDLREIDPALEYEVALAPTYEPCQPFAMNGSELQQFKIEIDGCPGSLIVEYRAVAR